MGLWNERTVPEGAGTDWIVRLRRALDAEPDGVGRGVGVVVADTNWGKGHGGSICADVLGNDTLLEAVAGLANHYDAEYSPIPDTCAQLQQVMECS